MLRPINLLILIAVSFSALTQESFFTCINENGKRVFSIKAYSVSNFSDELAAVCVIMTDGQKSFYRYGFVNKSGEYVIPCIYEDVHSFESGVSWVREPGSPAYHLINKQGEKLTNHTWPKVGYFINGFAAVYDAEGKMGFVNRLGEQVVPCLYTGSEFFSEGLACVMPYENVEASYGFIDTTGKVVIPFQYNQAGTSSFENGECRVQINGVTCLINKSGEVVFKPSLTKNCMGFYNGLSASYTSSNRTGWGYYNRQNTWVIKPQFDNAQSFINGLAIVEKAHKYGVIDTTGKIIIPIQYATLYGEPTEDGYFCAELEDNGQRLYFRADGSPFTNEAIQFLATANYHKLLPYCSTDGNYGYLNLDGSVAIPAAYKRAYSFADNRAWIQGQAYSLPLAKSATEAQFAQEYVVGDKAYCQKNGTGDFLPVTITQVSERYYLAKFADGSSVWAVYNQLKR